MTETEPIDVVLNQHECEHAANAAELYCKHLGRLESEAEKMNRGAESSSYREEAEGLRAELVEPHREGQRVQFYGRHLPIVAKGVEFLIFNMRAARGTVRPLGFSNWADELTQTASELETTLLPKFALQGQLPLSGNGDGEDDATE